MVLHYILRLSIFISIPCEIQCLRYIVDRISAAYSSGGLIFSFSGRREERSRERREGANVNIPRGGNEFRNISHRQNLFAARNLLIRGILISPRVSLSQPELYSVSYRCAGSYWKESGDLLYHSRSDIPSQVQARKKRRQEKGKRKGEER